MKELFITLLYILPLQGMAQSLPLQTFGAGEVRLLPGLFQQAQHTDEEYILALDADRLLAPFQKDAGIPVKKDNYGNWESAGLDGHIGGHYLSALSLMYAATGKQVYRQRLQYMLDQLEKCQLKNGDGYLGGIPEGKILWRQVMEGRGDAVTKRWVPWYNLHKTFNGLLDAWSLTGSTQARDMLLNLCYWSKQVTANLSDEQMQLMLQTEFGGMNEIYAAVAAATHDTSWLYMARRFTHRRLLDPLIAHRDSLTGLHANTQIPKVVGFMRTGMVGQDTTLENAAAFFWNTVVSHRSIAIGGNSVREHFNAVDNFQAMLESPEGPETCNSYNMLKLTRLLFLQHPDRKYMDYYERTLYNHILSSQHPNGGFVYFTPIHPMHYRVYSTPQQALWCCVGTGLENHGKYAEVIYAHAADALYVNLFIPSVLHWKSKSLTLTQETSFPEEDISRVTLHLKKASLLTIAIRKPAWVKESMTVTVNGQRVKQVPATSGYIYVRRIWRNGDIVKIHLPMTTSTEGLPDSTHWAAFLYGPIVLAAAMDTLQMPGLHADSSRWGQIARGDLRPMSMAPVLDLDSPGAVTLQRIGRSLEFSAGHLIADPAFRKLRLAPFYQLHDTRYMLYWPYVGKAAHGSSPSSERHEQQQLDSLTADRVYAGEQQPEADHQLEDEGSNGGTIGDQHYRWTRYSFSYTLKTKTAGAYKMYIRYRYTNADECAGVEIGGQQLLTLCSQPDRVSKDQVAVVDIGHLSAPGAAVKIVFRALAGKASPWIMEVRLIKVR
ncbi:hypothetical protein CLV59_105412 [Chitinophaga dinghuensis]|uniref:Uncharacterized protein n=1 Tax=Chitinophaga dinghuensis TaxID=1539050 RepID=A0A327VY77_9BACT|nr:beta-L-arabinofuranosidase domain-containing protein [Chitinophaga dinghuensis]RAJ80303.1 hypothetical protein CLV59_105412 [Chitinophaga dinghuensis]